MKTRQHQFLGSFQVMFLLIMRDNNDNRKMRNTIKEENFKMFWQNELKF